MCRALWEARRKYKGLRRAEYLGDERLRAGLPNLEVEDLLFCEYKESLKGPWAPVL
jgi:hypothetical protein